MAQSTENKAAGVCNVLIVDDDPDTVQLLQTIFTTRGYQTTAVYSGAEALNCVEARKPDIIILDIMLSGMDGWETFHHIRSLSDIPVIFLTAQQSGDNAAHALRTGVNEYIKKPFHPEELLARTEALLKRDKLISSFVRPVRNNRLVHSKFSVSVVIPTLNEAKNLPLLIPHLPMDGIDEVILVDGRSTDGTVEIAKQLLPSIKVILEPKPGKGAALRAGYEASKGDIIIVLDADGSHDPREIPRYIRSLLEGADIARGSRFAPGGGTTDMPRIRKLGNTGFVKLVNLLFDGTFTDITFGFHAFWRYCLERIEYRDMDGFEFEIGLYIRALRARLRIVDVPSFEGYRFTGIGKLQTIPDGWRILKVILWEWLKGLRRRNTDTFIGFRGNVRPQIWTPMLLQPQYLTGQGGHTIPITTNRFRPQAGDNLNLLHNILHDLASEFNLRDIQSSILLLTLEAMRAHSGSIIVLDENGRVIEGALVFNGDVRKYASHRLANVVELGLAGWVVRNQQPALVPNTSEDPRWLRLPWEMHEGASRSALGIPLMASDRVVGVLTLVRPAMEQFTADDLAMLTGAPHIV